MYTASVHSFQYNVYFNDYAMIKNIVYLIIILCLYHDFQFLDGGRECLEEWAIQSKKTKLKRKVSLFSSNAKFYCAINKSRLNVVTDWSCKIKFDVFVT